MKTAEEILLSSIKNYNSQINDLSKFALNERELKIFTDCIKLYANQKLDEAAELVSENFGLFEWDEDVNSCIISLKDKI